MNARLYRGLEHIALREVINLIYVNVLIFNFLKVFVLKKKQLYFLLFMDEMALLEPFLEKRGIRKVFYCYK